MKINENNVNKWKWRNENNNVMKNNDNKWNKKIMKYKNNE